MVFCAEKLAAIPAIYAEDTLIITQDIFDSFIKRVPEKNRSSLIELLQAIKFSLAICRLMVRNPHSQCCVGGIPTYTIIDLKKKDSKT